MQYEQMAKLELLNAVQAINSQSDLDEFKRLIANFFAQKAQNEIDAMWNSGQINQEVIEHWGEEHMRTTYRHASHRS